MRQCLVATVCKSLWCQYWIITSIITTVQVLLLIATVALQRLDTELKFVCFCVFHDNQRTYLLRLYSLLLNYNNERGQLLGRFRFWFGSIDTERVFGCDCTTIDDYVDWTTTNGRLWTDCESGNARDIAQLSSTQFSSIQSVASMVQIFKCSREWNDLDSSSYTSTVHD